jgi:hypothetical protein
MAIKLEQVPRSDDSTGREQPSLLRRRGLGLAVAAVAVVGAVIGVSLALTGGDPEKRSEVSGVVARPDQSPPRELIAAGQVAVSAYYTTKLVQQPGGDAVKAREWSLYNSATKRYEKTDWAWVDVAPGMKTAAVLEGDLPADRIGLMSLSTGKVQRWIDVDKGVGGVKFSQDGERLVATAYSRAVPASMSSTSTPAGRSSTSGRPRRTVSRSWPAPGVRTSAGAVTASCCGSRGSTSRAGTTTTWTAV